MNYGRFFVLDHDTSRLNKGIAVFNYHGLEAYPEEFNGETSKYPIYLTISKENIDFRVHYYNKAEEENISNYRHLHHTILSLPLSANIEVKDGLTSTLSDGYKTVFPIKREADLGSGSKKNRYYLQGLVEDYSEERYHNGISYANLKVFEVFDPSTNLIYGIPARNNERPNPTVNIEVTGNIEKKNINTYIRKLILDFIFDLEHTKVFQNSPHYEYVSIKLKENYFFSALANKANFYYYRQIIQERYKEEKQKESNEKPFSKSIYYFKLIGKRFKKKSKKQQRGDIDWKTFYITCLFKAEAEWTKSIRNVNSDDIFHASNGWFRHPENEMNDVYANRSYIEENIYRFVNGKETKNFVKKVFSDSSKWYIRRYAFLNTPFPGNKVKSIIIPSPLAILILFTIALFFVSVITPIELWHPDIIHLTQFLKLHAILAITLIMLFIIVLFRWLISPNRYFLGLHIFLPRLLIAIIASWVTIVSSTDMLDENSTALTRINNIVESKNKWLILLIATIVCITFSVYYQIQKYNPYGKFISNFKRTFFLCCLGFLYSYLIGKFLSFIFPFKNCTIENKFSLFLTPLPNSYLLFTFFALFFGTFLQLIVAEKPMTESL